MILENDRISGVLVSSSYNFKEDRGTETFRIEAGKGVILAGGGFGADIPFRMVQDPRLNREIDTTNKPFATAGLLKEAMRKGAAPVQLSHIQLGPWASPDEKGMGHGPLFSDYTGFIYGILIHPETGERFINEQSDRKILSDAILAAGKPCLCISDEAAVRHTGWDISRAVSKGVVKTFNTLETLAEEYGIPLQGLAATLSEFNNITGSKIKDRFGRKMPDDALPIQTLPYYAMRVWPKVHYTMGGVHIDTSARVLDLNQKAIPGLYAAGEITGGVHGACRLGSCAVTSCIVFGRIAGQTATAAGEL